MNILSIWTDVREVFFNLDGVGFAFIDNIYKLFISIAKTTLLNQKELNTILRNMYVIVGIFALFRIALFLINMIINPDNFNKEKAGVSQIFINTVVMIVLLVVTPMAFQLSRDVASKIVEGNYIQNIFLNIGSGENSETKKQTEPGQDMKRIAIAAVLTIDERIPLGGTKGVEMYNEDKTTTHTETIENTCSDCDDEASKAISCLYAIADGNPSGKYNIDSIRVENGGWKRLAAGYVTFFASGMNPIAAYSAYKATEAALTRITGGCLNADGSVDWSELAYYSTVKQKIDDEKVYVYDYKPLVLLIIGVVITLVLLSFTLDVAKRMIELAVLEIVSPLFIATYIDPKSSKSGPFKNWLTAVGKSYASLFIRLAIISIMLLCIRLLNYIDLGDGIGAIGKLVILIAFLMFCKSAPKWIEGLIGIDGGIGGGLWTPKKIGENMVGTKALRTGAAIGTAAAANRIANLAENHRRRKEADKNAGLEGKDRLNLKKRREKRAEINAQREKNGATASKSFFRNMAGLGNAVVQGGKAGIGASTIGGALKGAADVNARFKEQHAMGPGLVGKAKEKIGIATSKAHDAVWGDDEAIRREGIANDKLRKSYLKAGVADEFTNDNAPIKYNNYIKTHEGIGNCNDGRIADSYEYELTHSRGYTQDENNPHIFRKGTETQEKVIDSDGRVQYRITDTNKPGEVIVKKASDESMKQYGVIDEAGNVGSKSIFTKEGAAAQAVFHNQMQQTAVSSTIAANNAISQLAVAQGQIQANVQLSAANLAAAFEKSGIANSMSEVFKEGMKDVSKVSRKEFGAMRDQLSEQKQIAIANGDSDKASDIDALISRMNEIGSTFKTADNINLQMQQANKTVDVYKTVVSSAMADKKSNMPNELLVLLQKDATKLQKILDSLSDKSSNDGKNDKK